jgi:hypothetical protein
VNVPGDSFTIVNAVIFDGHAVLDADSLTVTDGVLTSVGPAPGTDADAGPRRIIDAATDLDSTIWLTGGGWSMSDFPGGAPTAAQLDALCAEVGVDRPIQLASADHHSTTVSPSSRGSSPSVWTGASAR